MTLIIRIAASIYIITLTFIANCQIYGNVISITDGDTFTLLTSKNEIIKIRLHGIDCPEKKQDYGNVAMQFTCKLIHKKNVRVNISDTDRYGRCVGIVYYDNEKCLNTELLKAGLAWHYKRYDNNIAWDSLQNDAKKHKKGIWELISPLPPWEFRKIIKHQ